MHTFSDNFCFLELPLNLNLHTVAKQTPTRFPRFHFETEKLGFPILYRVEGK